MRCPICVAHRYYYRYGLIVSPFLSSFVESLRSDGRFPRKEGHEEGGDGDKEPEETLTWTLFLRAQLEERTGFLQEASDTLEVKPR